MKIIDNDLHLMANWETHSGDDIAGKPNSVRPTSTGWRDLAGGRQFYIGGPGGADVLYAIHRTVPVAHGNFHLSFQLMTDSACLSVGRCLEFDSIVTLDKLKYNMSSQFNFNSGQFQISDVNGGWVNTGLSVDRFIPYWEYRLEYDYWFDSVAHRYSMLGVSLNGSRYAIPAALQNLTAIPTDWADVISLQVQLDLDTQGGGFAIVMGDVDYTWDLP